jgi:type IV secretory pathway VirB10-like protein
MTERRRRRRRTLLVPVLGLGVAAWAVHRKLGERHSLDDGWQPLPPAAPVARRTAAGPVLPPVPDDAVAEPAAAVPAEPAAVEAATDVPAEPAPVEATTDVAAEPVEQTAAEPEPSAAEAEPVDPAEPAEQPRTRAVAAAAAVASVTAPALPDTPFGPGSLRALDDGSSPDPEYTVKGKSATKIFHVPGGAYYTRTRADVWFRSARDARGAGFTERTRRSADR